jgi:hypothetical protein
MPLRALPTSKQLASVVAIGAALFVAASCGSSDHPNPGTGGDDTGGNDASMSASSSGGGSDGNGSSSSGGSSGSSSGGGSSDDSEASVGSDAEVDSAASDGSPGDAEASVGPDAEVDSATNDGSPGDAEASVGPDAEVDSAVADSAASDGSLGDAEAGVGPDGGLGQTCTVDSNCMSNACDAVSTKCVADQCADHRKDGAETDVDCGGGTCPACANPKKCAVDTDCASMACDGTSLTCVANQCADHRKDGAESDVDCGGSGLCLRCVVGKTCTASNDCQAGHTCSVSVPHVCQ